jgi:hypothetical protein
MWAGTSVKEIETPYYYLGACVSDGRQLSTVMPSRTVHLNRIISHEWNCMVLKNTSSNHSVNVFRLMVNGFTLLRHLTLYRDKFLFEWGQSLKSN